MDIYDIQSGFKIATFVFLMLAIVFIIVASAGLLFGCKLVWALAATLLCGGLAILFLFAETFIDSL